MNYCFIHITYLAYVCRDLASLAINKKMLQLWIFYRSNHKIWNLIITRWNKSQFKINKSSHLVPRTRFLVFLCQYICIPSAASTSLFWYSTYQENWLFKSMFVSSKSVYLKCNIKEALVDILRKAISEALWNVEIMSKTMDVPNENGNWLPLPWTLRMKMKLYCEW